MVAVSEPVSEPVAEPVADPGPGPEAGWRSAFAAFGPEAAVVALALALNLWNLSVNGYGNTYYAAAVRSMSGSWHDFFYASVDPGGWITVDKPPLALWVQALSVRLFGYSSWSMLVPGALAGAGAVLLVVVIGRRWDRTAGLVAGLALATMPVAVAVARSNNPDGMLVLLVVAAAAALLRAVETGRLRWLLAAAGLVAAAFLTKLLVALVVLPTLWLTYWMFARQPWRRRLAHLVGASVLLAVLSGGWVVAVDHTPLSSRPWIGGSTDGSAADLVLGYNGIGRITGADEGPGGGGFPGGGGGGGGGGFPGGGGFGGFGGIDQFGGSPGITRLFNAGMGDQVMWLAPLAAAAALAGLYAVVRRRREGVGGAVVVLLAGWAATAFVVFSFAQGIFHNYYVSLLAPAVAGLAGIGVSQLLRAGHRGRAVAAGVVVVTAVLQLVLLRRVDADAWLRPAVTVALLAVAAGLSLSAISGVQVSRRAFAGLVGAGVAVVLVAPAAWSFGGDRYAPAATFPDARPATDAVSAGPFGAGGDGFPGVGGGGPGAGLDDALLGWLRDQRDGERWLVAVGSVQQASTAIIDGDSVMPMGGFTGGDPAMTPARLAELVRDGDLRFVLAGGFGGFGGLGGGGGVDTVVTSACTEVPATAWGGDQAASGTLYDCKGKADAITEAGESAPSGTGTGAGAPGGLPGGGGFDELQGCLADQGVTLPDGGGGGGGGAPAPDLADPDLLDALEECGLPAGGS